MSKFDIELGTQVFSTFIFPTLFTPDLPLNSKAHHNVKMAAFKIVQDMYQQSYNCALDPLLDFRENSDDVTLPRDKCVHYLIIDIKNVLDVLDYLKNQPKFKYSMYVFLPYIKQISVINNLFANDHCCSSIVKANESALNVLRDLGEKYVHVIRLMNERMHLINVFTEPKIYQCNICQDASVDEQFLKPNECCGYNMCNKCYANLWKYCNMYPVCPVCRTSFKSPSKQMLERE